MLQASDQKQRRVFQQIPQFFQIFGAECTVNYSMVTAHRDRHAMAYDDLIAIIDYWNFRNLADREDKTLRRIDDGGEAVNAPAAKFGDSERAALKFFRLHSLGARAMPE